MAAPTQRFTPDTGSQEVKLLRTQVNYLVDLVEALVAAAVTADGDGDDLAAALALFDASALRRLVAKPETLNNPLPPAV